jgi:hypothetical protein
VLAQFGEQLGGVLLGFAMGPIGIRVLRRQVGDRGDLGRQDAAEGIGGRGGGELIRSEGGVAEEVLGGGAGDALAYPVGVAFGAPRRVGCGARP